MGLGCTLSIPIPDSPSWIRSSKKEMPRTNQPYDWPLDQLESYRPNLTRREGFWALWDESRRLLKGKSAAERGERCGLSERCRRLKLCRDSRVSGSDGGRMVRLAQETRPIARSGCLSWLRFNFEGGVRNVVNWVLHGCASLGLLVRGQPTGWMPQRVLSPDQCYYRGVHLDAIRAIEWVATQDDVDGNAIGVTEISRGGGVLFVAAARPEVSVATVVAEYPYLGHFKWAVDVASECPYGETNEFLVRNGRPNVENQRLTTLSYFDAMNSPDIHCPMEVAVGLVDTSTLPSTIFAAYNHISDGDKAIFVYRGFGHEPMPLFQTQKLSLLRSRLILQSAR